ncbi:MAG TPA: Fis family transcriptional regulator [Planctomycetaceae bacterium]|nr:Fis family transcriptional regulator [Planctomycetaceae bacterium]
MNILIIDDEQGIRTTLASVLEDERYHAFSAEDAIIGLDILSRQQIDLIFLDVLLPNMGGLEALERIRKDFPQIEIIVISGHANIDMAVRAVKLGAFDFLEKPLSLDKVLTVTRNAIAIQNLRKENIDLKKRIAPKMDILGVSKQIEHIRALIKQAAQSDARILISGENGTGKEVAARAVHDFSSRADKCFVEVNCAAIPDTLIESELFGHEKGAFTDAVSSRKGRFEMADGGTLFLDEIGEMSQALQAKFLRVLEGHPFERVGGNAPIVVDARVIAATNRDLEKEVAGGHFRHDLFFRLRVLEIIIPPLRKRLEDIPILADYFLDKFSKETGRKYQGFSPEAMRVLMNYRWPGNIRELKNVVERAVVLSAGPWVQESDLLLTTLHTTGETDIRRESTSDIFVPLSLDDVERNHIMRTLNHLQWNKSLASKLLGIERTTLDRKIKRYGLEKGE